MPPKAALQFTPLIRRHDRHRANASAMSRALLGAPRFRRPDPLSNRLARTCSAYPRLPRVHPSRTPPVRPAAARRVRSPPRPASKSSCADLFRVSTPFSGASLPYAASPAHGCTSPLLRPRQHFQNPLPPIGGRGRGEGGFDRSEFALIIVLRGLVPRIHAFLGCIPGLRRQAGPRLHVALDRHPAPLRNRLARTCSAYPRLSRVHPCPTPPVRPAAARRARSPGRCSASASVFQNPLPHPKEREEPAPDPIRGEAVSTAREFRSGAEIAREPNAVSAVSTRLTPHPDRETSESPRRRSRSPRVCRGRQRHRQSHCDI
jgi:hypothetical protein